jgi:hypothetical protein
MTAVITVKAQSQAEGALIKDGKTLNERYAVMKDKSETFNEYKVIKEYVLDGMWKITNDSINKVQAELVEARKEIEELKLSVSAAASAIKQKEDSMAEIEFASTHISVLGIDFKKSFFIGLVGFVLLGMILLIGAVTGRLKMIYQSLKEKMEMENLISKEFEIYKRKALEKQMKLSRELQNERNKMAEMRSA